MVHYEPLKHCHVSGHGSREELKLMLGLVKPRHFIPVHGEYRMLVQHALLAEGAGRRDRQHLRAREWAGGRVRRHARPAGRQRAGRRVLVDGIASIDGIDGVDPARPAHARLRRRGDGRADGRRRHRARGLRARTWSAAASCPTRTTRSWPTARDHLANRLCQPAGDDDHAAESGYLKAKIRDTLARFFFERTKRRPMILPIVMEV